MTWWQLVLLGWGVMAVVMAALWLVQYVRHNAGIVDVAWSFGTGLLGVLLAWGHRPRRARSRAAATPTGFYQRTTSVFVPWPPKREVANANPEVNP